MENLTPRQSYQPPPSARTSVGKYEMVALVGRGGMGEVLKCVEPQSGKYVAIKVLDADAYRDEDLLRRFHREAQSALALDHINIARFYGMEYDEMDRPIIVMEFIEGIPMDRWLKDNTEAAFSQIVDFAIQTARGLENAYRRSIIHRDIKPSNLIVTPEGVVKIIDFGLAKSMWDTSGLTGTGMVVGTPRYISPEQGMGRNVDHRSDIYSLGATLYELLTRQSPFDGDTPMAIMLKHINTPLVPPYLVNPRVPGDINEIVIRMMAKDPKERFQDYEPLIRELESAKIHRLAKERRSAEMDTAMLGQAPTVSLHANVDGSPPRTSSQHRPSSYLSEGLVNVSFTAPEERPSSPASKVILSIAGLAIVGMAVGALMAPRQVEGKKQPSWLAQQIAGALKKSTKKNTGPSAAEQQAHDDQEKIKTTSGRMEALVSKLLEYRDGHPGAEASMQSLRDAGQLTDDESQDAWGNDFYLVSDGGGGGTLVSKGRDGEDNSGDELKYSLDGTQRVIPPALKVDEFPADTEQPAKP